MPTGKHFALYRSRYDSSKRRYLFAFTQSNTLEDFDLQLHRCENIKSRLIQGVSGGTFHSSGERSSSKYVDITKDARIQSPTIAQIVTREKFGILTLQHAVPV
jgi:hypothetical protein